MSNKIKDAFRPDSSYRAFFISILTFALAYGLYKGIIDNYLAEVVGMSEFDKGVSEFFRETPGLLLIFVLAMLYEHTASRIYRIGAVIMVAGLVMQSVISPTKVLVIVAIFIYSLGEHIQLGMRNTLTLEFAKEGKSGIALGRQHAVYQIGRPYVLVLFYGATAMDISILFTITSVCSYFASPLVGRIIDRFGYKIVMISDTLILVIVCFFYGFAHHIFPMHVAFIVCCANYVLDSIISLASMASNVYVQDLADNADEMRATISTGVSVNHFITILVALFGGWIWKVLGIETLFILSAILGLCNSAYAATIKTGKQS